MRHAEIRCPRSFSDPVAPSSAYAQTAPTQPSLAGADSPHPPTAPVDRTVSTGDFNAKGDMAASALIGTKVRNANKESIGKIDEIYLDKDAKVTDVVISVGGFSASAPRTSP